MPLKDLLRSAIIAGLMAGTLSAGFHWIFTEPVIDRAVELEERAHSSSPRHEAAVGRPAQKFGLFLGFFLYGGASGLFVGLLVYAARPWFAGMSYAQQGFLFAALLGWSAGIFPLLKYPANPPGVGEAETIGYRQEIFLACAALSFLGVVLAIAIKRWTGPGAFPWIIVVNFYAMYLMLLLVALPPNPDPVKAPAELVDTFRGLSLYGQALLWGAMASIFWWLCRTRD
ncbi:MAG TPA: CbtA family protein [Candidatus Binatia bacterium]|jgi:predicted cobalt transporter CbtA